MIKFSCSIAKTFQNLIHFKGSDSPKIPLWNNCRFTLNGRPLRNEVWDSKGIRILEDIINQHDRKLKTFEQLKIAYGIKGEDYLKYMHIRSQLTRYLGEAVTFPKVTDTESKLELTINQKVKIA